MDKPVSNSKTGVDARTFMFHALNMAKNSTCLDRQVGVILIDKDGHIKAHGYNKTSCTNICLKQKGFKCPAIHAEIDLLRDLKIKERQIDPEDILFVTYKPCIDCMVDLEETGLKQLYYLSYNDTEPEHEEVLGIKMTNIPFEFNSSLDDLLYDINIFHSIIGWPEKHNKSIDQTKEAQILFLALYQEVAELVNSVNWKPWRTNFGGSIPKGHLKEELADIFFFWASLLDCFNISVDEIKAAIADKLIKNRNRETEKRQ